MSKEPQRIALPSVLRENLQAFRIWQGREQKYLVNDPEGGQANLFEPWQFFVLEVIGGCDDFEKLASVFEDRFGTGIKFDETRDLVRLAAKRDLLNLYAREHPLVSTLLDDSRGGRSEASAMADKESDRDSKSGAASLPAGVFRVLGMDPSVPLKGFKLFNPEPLLRRLLPVVLPLKYLVYLVPLMLIAAFFIAANHSGQIISAIEGLKYKSFLWHMLFGLVTVNLVATLSTAFTALAYRGSVPAFCLVFYFGFLPRFMVRTGHVEQFTRRERIWLHASPLLARIILSCIGIFLWYCFSGRSHAMSVFGLMLAIVGLVSFFITANPLVNSNGYNLLAAFLDATDFRKQAYMALVNRIRGNVFKEADGKLLSAYILVSGLFMFLLFLFFLFVFTCFLDFHFGGISITVFVCLFIWLLWNAYRRFSELNEDYNLKLQFERWRKRTFAAVEDDTGVARGEPDSPFWKYLRRSALALLCAGLFVPYHYEACGSFDILPLRYQEITSDISGIIQEVYYDGGEHIEKGSLIGRLSVADYESQLNICNARIEEQKALIADMKAKPLPEKVRLAEEVVEVQKVKTGFSAAKLARLEKLYRDGTISFEDYDEQKRQYEVDMEELKQKNARVDLVKVGTTEEELAAAEAKLKSIEAERDYYLERMEQSLFYMPFDGHLTGLNLKQKAGSFLERGAALAIAENTDRVYAKIYVPETQIGMIRQDSVARIRPWAYPDLEFTGHVVDIASTVSDRDMNNIVEVQVIIDNPDGLLKPGMEGYAKISGEVMQVWKIVFNALGRFMRIEAWSWLP